MQQTSNLKLFIVHFAISLVYTDGLLHGILVLLSENCNSSKFFEEEMSILYFISLEKSAFMPPKITGINHVTTTKQCPKGEKNMVPIIVRITIITPRRNKFIRYI